MPIGRGRPATAAARADAAERQRRADDLAGALIVDVRYVTIDYRREELRPDLLGTGARHIEAEEEWAEPTWRYGGFDALDYGLELVTEAGDVWSLTWDPPGERDSLSVERGTLWGGDGGDAAVWSVRERASGCLALVGRRVVGVDLHHEHWSGELGCERITIRGEAGRVEVMLGDAEDGALRQSSDNVAVLHPGVPLPDWADRGD